MSKFNCAREYQLSKHRYDGMFIFRDDEDSRHNGAGLRLISLLIIMLSGGVLFFGFIA